MSNTHPDPVGANKMQCDYCWNEAKGIAAQILASAGSVSTNAARAIYADVFKEHH